MFPNWAKSILFLLVYMISGLVLVIIIEGLLSGSDLTPLNTAVQNVIVHLRTPIVTTAIVWITRIGNPFVIASIALFISVILILKRNPYEAMLFLVSMIVAVISFTILKNVFQVSRPVSDIYKIEGWSFPSGHAAVSTAFFFMLAHIFWGKMKSTTGRVCLIVGSILGIAFICFSRLYLGAHWALDVLAGMALGALSVSFTVLMFSLLLSHRRSVRKIIDL